MIRLIIALLMSVSVAGQAVEMKHLYEATVAAQNNLTKEKEAAFIQVLVRVTGDPDVTSNSVVNKSILSVADYLVQFSYREIDGKHQFWAQFDPKQVQKLLQQAKLPVWGNQRPRTLFWVVKEESKGREIVADSTHSAVRENVLEQAEIRGLPAIFPLMDLNDSTLVSTSDVWGSFTQPVIEASERYDADVMVLAKLYPLTESQWLLSWELFGRKVGGRYTSITNGEIRQSQGGAVKQMVNEVSERLARLYAINANSMESDKIVLQVLGIDRTEDYVGMSRLLNQSKAISSHHITRLDSNKATWELTMLGGTQELMHAFALDKRLAFIGMDQPTALASDNTEAASVEEGKKAINVLSPELINKYPVVHYQWQK